MSVLSRDRLADQVYRVLRDQILSRTLLPAQRLSVPYLAESLGTSRSPVREAVQRLVSEGLADERPNHGAVVASPNLVELAQLYQVRAILEGLAAELMTARRTTEEVEHLRTILEEHKAAFARHDVPAVIELDLSFHRSVGEATGNGELMRVLSPIHGRVMLAILAGRPESWPSKAISEHQAILDAIASGDARRARRMGERHVLLVRERLLAKAGERHTAGDGGAAAQGQQAVHAETKGSPG